MVLQIQSDEPVVTLKESEYFKLKHAKEIFASKQLADEKFIAALVKELAIARDIKVSGSSESGAWHEANFTVPGYTVWIKVSKGKELKYMYTKIDQ